MFAQSIITHGYDQLLCGGLKQVRKMSCTVIMQYDWFKEYNNKNKFRLLEFVFMTYRLYLLPLGLLFSINLNSLK